jgi:hypothetical protein
MPLTTIASASSSIPYNNYLAGQEWAKRGWKERNDEHASSNAMSIVAAAVRPSLV